MSLPEMLSALRQLILDDIPVIDPMDDRILDYQKRFPKLSTLEIEDLAKMPRDRLNLYTTSIFSSQSKMLERNLPFTFAVLNRGWKKMTGKSLNTFGFVRKVHSRFPWKSTDAWIVAQNVTEYLAKFEPDLIREEPALVDIARLETLTWEMRKSLNDKPLPTQVEVDAIPALSVEELLALRVHISNSFGSLETDFNVAPSRRAFMWAEQETISEITERKVFQVGGRSKVFVVLWEEVSKSLYKVFEDFRGREDLHVSNLAEGFLSDLPEGTPDEESLIKFVQLLARLMELGVLRLAKEFNEVH